MHLLNLNAEHKLTQKLITQFSSGKGRVIHSLIAMILQDLASESLESRPSPYLVSPWPKYRLIAVSDASVKICNIKGDFGAHS